MDRYYNFEINGQTINIDLEKVSGYKQEPLENGNFKLTVICHNDVDDISFIVSRAQLDKGQDIFDWAFRACEYRQEQRNLSNPYFEYLFDEQERKYFIKFKQKCTVGQFLDYVSNHVVDNEDQNWGNVNIANSNYYQKYYCGNMMHSKDKINHFIPKALLDLKIKKAEVDGNWTLLNYKLYTEPFSVVDINSELVRIDNKKNKEESDVAMKIFGL